MAPEAPLFNSWAGLSVRTFSAGSSSEPIHENWDVSEILPPSAALAFSFVWATGTSFPWHTASPDTACKACSLSFAPCFYSSIAFRSKPSAKQSHQTQWFPSSLHPSHPSQLLSSNLQSSPGLAAPLGMAKLHLPAWGECPSKLHLPGLGGVPNQVGCPGGWSQGGSSAAKAM